MRAVDEAMKEGKLLEFSKMTPGEEK